MYFTQNQEQKNSDVPVSLIQILSATQFKKKERSGIPKSVFDLADQILCDIRKDGIVSVIQYTKQFDGIDLNQNTIKISKEDIESASSKLSVVQKQAIDEAYFRVERAQGAIAKNALLETRISIGDGYVLLRSRAIERVGIYVPGGRAPLPSSLLMAGVTARAAGVKDIVVCTPPQKDGNLSPAILYVAQKLKISNIYQIGGAQAISAMACGLPGILEKVDMICGPGNVYAAAAKQIVSSQSLVKIDLAAGPSEVLIIADETGNSKFIAADMLAQAEHGINSPAILLTSSKNLAQKVSKELELQLENLKPNEIAKQSIKNFGAIVLVSDVEEAIELANDYAPEHLEVFVRYPEIVAKKLTNAGAIFINTCESFADYGMSGGNHILPTGGSAKFLSGLSVYDFLVRTYVEFMSDKDQQELAKFTEVFAALEGLEAHSKAAGFRGVQNV
ncbi:histidinol dehydrogenase [Candidatus Micrarchaeota archaeon]|nr:histidinol dehydrogenase [Candidatus Micrarchaeota archaeon]